MREEFSPTEELERSEIGLMRTKTPTDKIYCVSGYYECSYFDHGGINYLNELFVYYFSNDLGIVTSFKLLGNKNLRGSIDSLFEKAEFYNLRIEDKDKIISLAHNLNDKGKILTSFSRLKSDTLVSLPFDDFYSFLEKENFSPKYPAYRHFIKGKTIVSFNTWFSEEGISFGNIPNKDYLIGKNRFEFSEGISTLEDFINASKILDEILD